MKNTLSKEQFSEAVKGMISLQMGKDYRVILYRAAKNNGIIKEASEHGTDIIILPSSIHEVLLLPHNGMHDVSSLFTMVNEVNDEVVNPEEVLSDNIYVYKMESDIIKIME